MLKHGENIVDMMGGEIDRIEMKLRVSKTLCKNVLWLIFFLDQSSRDKALRFGNSLGYKYLKIFVGIALTVFITTSIQLK